MPGYTIHLAIANEYMKHNKVEDEADFIRGVISPDLFKTSDSHFGIKQNKLDFDELKKRLKNPIIFDGRNVYDHQKMNELGFEYYCIGVGSNV